MTYQYALVSFLHLALGLLVFAALSLSAYYIVLRFANGNDDDLRKWARKEMLRLALKSAVAGVAIYFLVPLIPHATLPMQAIASALFPLMFSTYGNLYFYRALRDGGSQSRRRG
jgi:peptidoglycan biosynthesis protein MviN/MurJ (putative lipid II flippase)